MINEELFSFVFIFEEILLFSIILILARKQRSLKLLEEKYDFALHLSITGKEASVHMSMYRDNDFYYYLKRK